MFVFLWFPFPSSYTQGYGLNCMSLTTSPKFTYWKPLPPVPLNVTLFGNRFIAGVINDGVECIPNTVRLLTLKRGGGGGFRHPHRHKENVMWSLKSASTAKECPTLLTKYQLLGEKLGTDSSPAPSERALPCHTLVSQFLPPELWYNKLQSFKAINVWYFITIY